MMKPMDASCFTYFDLATVDVANTFVSNNFLLRIDNDYLLLTFSLGCISLVSVMFPKFKQL